MLPPELLYCPHLKVTPVRTLGLAGEVTFCLLIGGDDITWRPVRSGASLFLAGRLLNLCWGIFSIHSASCLPLGLTVAGWAGSATGLVKSRLRGRTYDGADGSSSEVGSGINGST